MVGKNQKGNLLCDIRILYELYEIQNLGTKLYQQMTTFRIVQQAKVMTEMALPLCATSSIYYLALSIKSLPSVKQCSQSPNCGQEIHHKLPHTGLTANSLLWGRLNQNLYWIPNACNIHWPFTEWQPLL